MNKTIKTVTGGIMMAFLTLQASAQAPMVSIEDGGKKPVAKMDTASVPKEVRTVWYTEYPTVTYYEWYGYPSLKEDSGWYDTEAELYSREGMPEYYITEFVRDETPHRAIYSKTGKKVAVHKSMKKTVLPMAVSDAFKKSKYKSWKETGEKVEMLKDADKTKAYKITVTDGKEKHALFYDEKGKILKDKKIKM